MEIWKEIPELNGFYSASNLGRIKSNERHILRNNNRTQKINEKVLTPIQRPSGYLKVRLCATSGKQINLSVHSLIASAFFGEKKKGFHINHINGIKTDNRVENLEYCTAKQNINHAWQNGLSSNDHCKKQILFGDKIYNSVNECESSTGINRNTIAKCANKGFYIDRKYKVVYGNNEFDSLKDAARHFNLNPKTIAKYGKVLKPNRIQVKWITI